MKKKLITRIIKFIDENGMDNFSMRKLAKYLDTSPSNLYNYFKGKEDIVNQVFKTVITQFIDEVDRGIDDLNGENFFIVMFDRLVIKLKENISIVKVMLMEIRSRFYKTKERKKIIKELLEKLKLMADKLNMNFEEFISNFYFCLAIVQKIAEIKILEIFEEKEFDKIIRDYREKLEKVFN